jgi:hypothetical protein
MFQGWNMDGRRMWKTRIWVGAALVLLAMAIPRRVYISDEYRVAVTDEAGNPLPQMKVRQFVQDYSFGDVREGTGEIRTDERGGVTFPARTRWLSFGEETLGCVGQIFSQFVHASCGSYTDVSVEPEKFVEASRSEVSDSRQAHRRLLTIRFAACPSGDWITCTQNKRAQPR